MYKKEGEPNERPRRNGSMEKMLVQKAYQRQAPVNGSLELLPLCNMNCDMCYVRLSKAEMEQKGRFKNQRRMDQTGSSDEGCRNIISVVDRRRAVIISRI